MHDAMPFEDALVEVEEVGGWKRSSGWDGDSEARRAKRRSPKLVTQVEQVRNTRTS